MAVFKKRLVLIFITIVLLLVTQNGRADQRRPYAMPNHGTLILTVPSSWKQEVSSLNDQFPTISFFPSQGDDFRVLIAPLWSPTKDPSFNQPARIKNLIETDLTSMQSQALEKKVAIQTIKGTDGEGYYFLLTDKNPKPGEYPYLMRAGMGVGDLLISVTVLSRSKGAEVFKATIKLLREARQEKDEISSE